MIGHANDIGLSEALLLTNIQHDTTLAEEDQRFDKWATLNNMLCNGEKTVELRARLLKITLACFFNFLEASKSQLCPLPSTRALGESS